MLLLKFRHRRNRVEVAWAADSGSVLYYFFYGKTKLKKVRFYEFKSFPCTVFTAKLQQ